jgi:hypothetical protein
MQEWRKRFDDAGWNIYDTFAGINVLMALVAFFGPANWYSVLIFWLALIIADVEWQLGKRLTKKRFREQFEKDDEGEG